MYFVIIERMTLDVTSPYHLFQREREQKGSSTDYTSHKSGYRQKGRQSRREL